MENQFFDIAVILSGIKGDNPFELEFAAYNYAVEHGITDHEKAHDFAFCALEGVQYDVVHNTTIIPAKVLPIAKRGRRFATSSVDDNNDNVASVVPSHSQDSNSEADNDLADFETEEKSTPKPIKKRSQRRRLA